MVEKLNKLFNKTLISVEDKDGHRKTVGMVRKKLYHE